MLTFLPLRHNLSEALFSSLILLVYIHVYKVCLKSNGGRYHNQFILIPNKQGFLFKVILFESNALSHSSLSYFYALLEGFFWDAFQLYCYDPLDSLYTFKIGLLDDPFECGGEKRKSHGARSGE